MKYKIGDKVKIKSLDWFKANEYNGQGTYDDVLAFLKMTDECCGKELTIDFIFTDERGTGYIMKEPNASQWRFTDSMIECLVERNGKTYLYKIGDRVILKGNNRRATITDLKYNSWGNLSYYIKIDNDKDITVDYPTELLLPYDNVVKDVVDTKPQDKMVSLDKVCEMLYAMLTTQDINDYDYVTAPAYDTVEDLVEDFRKSFEE
jgi:hypothetical protein